MTLHMEHTSKQASDQGKSLSDAVMTYITTDGDSAQDTVDSSFTAFTSDQCPENDGLQTYLDLGLQGKAQKSIRTPGSPQEDLASLSSTVERSNLNQQILSRLGPRLTSKMPFDDGAIAFGTIQIYDKKGENGSVKTYIRGREYDDQYPNILIRNGRTRNLRLDGLTIGTRGDTSYLRVYIIPQDVESSKRGNIKDYRKMVKYLLNFVDCSAAAWNGETDKDSPIITYPSPLCDSEESLFYIFNTLSSPSPDPGRIRKDGDNYRAMKEALHDRINGVKTPLLSHQKRTIAAMVQKESSPTNVDDPRKVKMLDIYGNEFYLDQHDGSLCRYIPLYSEPRGGILAESMGYGKTLICLALVLATRGHYPKIPEGHIEADGQSLHPTMPSLLSMAARSLKYQGQAWKNKFYILNKQGLYYDRCMTELQKYERSYLKPASGYKNPRRSSKIIAHDEVVHLCSSTLVIVPHNLLVQWQAEIENHIDSNALDVLVIDEGMTIPKWEALVTYDLVLMSRRRFQQEHQGVYTLGTKGSEYKSPLTEIHWLRVICDEGHSFAGSASKSIAMTMLDKLSVERRWVVSGTPSSSLHGVDVSIAATNLDTGSNSDLEDYSSVLKNRKAPILLKTEDKDLDRLRTLVTNFFKLQPWSNKKGDDTADWQAYLAPKADAAQVRRSMPALRDVMQTLIVRHRIEDIECDLPKLHTKIVHIEPSYFDKISVNLFLMVLASNYVTSEREDQDYMFHPKNRGKLTQLINNLGHSTFYWIGFAPQHVQDSIRIMTGYLNENIDKVSDADGALLTQAIEVGRKALADKAWTAFSTLHEMGTYLHDFPDEARAAWSLDQTTTNPLLLGSTQARALQRRDHLKTGARSDDPESLLRRHGIKTMSAARTRAAEEESQRGRKGVESEKTPGALEVPVRRPTPQKPRREKYPEIVMSDDTDGLESTHIAGFASAKLTYLCNRLRAHSDEKTIIFYTDNNAAFFIGEALELLAMPFRIYANTLSVSQRAQYLAQFNTDPELKVLVMDLKQAGQGLHVAAASRVYLVSPVWDAAIESQAIKRAHRIGQTREVFVETLVLRGTFEEALIRRRGERADTSAESRAMLDDSVMVRVLKEIAFLEVRDDEERFVRLDRPVPLMPPVQTVSAPPVLPAEVQPITEAIEDVHIEGTNGCAERTFVSVFGARADGTGPGKLFKRPLVEGEPRVEASSVKRVRFAEDCSVEGVRFEDGCSVK